MPIWPTPGTTGERLVDELKYIHNKSQNVFAGSTGSEIIPAYLRWVAETERRLRAVIRTDDLDRLLLTRRYWAVLNNPEYTPHNMLAVQQEVQAREAAFASALNEAKALVARWAHDVGAVAFVVADTNVYLEHPQQLPDLDWREALGRSNLIMDDVRVIVPLLVIDELDDAKSDRVRSRARQALKHLYGYFAAQVNARHTLQPRSSDSGQTTIELLYDEPSHVRLPRADDELVDRAAAVQSFISHPVDFISYDTGAVLRAKAAGLRAHRREHTVPPRNAAR